MHYFQFEIKEWIANTAHLSLEEEAAYLRLIFYYYDSEKPISQDDLLMVFRKCRVPESIGKGIMLEFFTCDNGWWFHKRCDEEIARYHAKQEQASRAGKASAERRLNARSTPVQPIINQESIINNQIKPKATKVAPPDGVSESVWSDFLILRKSKKLPLTPTALKGIEREANLARKSLAEVIQICCERGWAGFKAEWLAAAPGKTIPDPPPKKWHQSIQGIQEKARELNLDTKGFQTIGQLESAIRRHLGE